MLWKPLRLYSISNTWLVFCFGERATASELKCKSRISLATQNMSRIWIRNRNPQIPLDSSIPGKRSSWSGGFKFHTFFSSLGGVEQIEIGSKNKYLYKLLGSLSRCSHEFAGKVTACCTKGVALPVASWPKGSGDVVTCFAW